MKKVELFIWFIALCLPVFLNGQNDNAPKGIDWTEGLSWQQILNKAKIENKYIFLDCYATWCGPCKKMDNEVYTDEVVGKYLNEKFISVKVQLDKTEYDNDFVKSWYTTASAIQRNYSVTAFPSFLFFSPEGKPVHKEVGFKNAVEFIAVSKNALTPDKQYYAILHNYQPGKFDTAELKGLAYAFQHSGKELSWKLANEYFNRIPKAEWGTKENLLFMGKFAASPEVQKITAEYLKSIPGKRFIESDIRFLITYNKQSPQVRDIVLDYLGSLDNAAVKDFSALLDIFQKEPGAKRIAEKYIFSLKESELYSRNNLFFMGEFTTTPSDRAFPLFYKKGAIIDSITGANGFSKTIVKNAIGNEIITPYWEEANKTGEAPWREISRTIKRKYSKELAEEIVLNAKVNLYKYRAEKLDKNWGEYVKYNIQKIEKYGTDTTSPASGFIDATQLNNFAFDGVLKHSSKKKEINSAIRWMEGVIRRHPNDANYMDTYANLLYKDGKTKEAIQWQEKALQITDADKSQELMIPSIKDNLTKMKQGIPTWVKEIN